MKLIVGISIILYLLVSAPLPAETYPEIDVEKLFAMEKELIKDSMQLTEEEVAVFWPLYDDYEKIAMEILNIEGAKPPTSNN